MNTMIGLLLQIAALGTYGAIDSYRTSPSYLRKKYPHWDEQRRSMKRAEHERNVRLAEIQRKYSGNIVDLETGYDRHGVRHFTPVRKEDM